MKVKYQKVLLKLSGEVFGGIQKYGIDPQVMDVKVPLRMGQPDRRWIDLVEPVDLADLRGDIVVQTLQGISHVRVLIDLPVRTVQVAVDQVHIRAGNNLPDARVLLAVDDIGLCGALELRGEENFFHDILDLLDGRDPPGKRLLRKVEHPESETSGSLLVEFAGCFSCTGYSRCDLVRAKRNDDAIALLD